MSVTYGHLAKATIINVLSRESVECLFRPKEFTISKTNSWGTGTAGTGAGGRDAAIGLSMAPPTFQGGQPKTLQMNLLFDTCERPPGSRDVRQRTRPLW